jgi:hypothetical protein
VTRVKNVLHVVRTGSGGTPGLLSNGYWGLFPSGQSGRGAMLTTHLQLVTRSRKVDLYIHSLIRLHGVVLNSLSTKTNLPFYLRVW